MPKRLVQTAPPSDANVAVITERCTRRDGAQDE
jgi:hypothetical protein